MDLIDVEVAEPDRDQMPQPFADPHHQDVPSHRLHGRLPITHALALGALGRMGSLYLRELGEGPHRSGDIAVCFKAAGSSLAPTRSCLISKGMIWSPDHGDTAFTAPMFDQFMQRIIPGDDWR
jgi:hypothetical protein